MSTGGDLPCAGDGGAGDGLASTYWTGDPFLTDLGAPRVGWRLIAVDCQPPSFYGDDNANRIPTPRRSRDRQAGR